MIPPECVERAELRRDSANKPFIDMSLSETAYCHGKMNAWLENHVGEAVSFYFGEDRISGPSRVYSGLPAAHIRVASENVALLKQIAVALADQ